MKKTLLIITLFIGFGNINAQSDTTNNATLEETIDWINIYGSSLLKKYTEPNFKDPVFSIKGMEFYWSYYDPTYDSKYEKIIENLKTVSDIVFSPLDNKKFRLIIRGGRGKSTLGGWDDKVNIILAFQNKDDAKRFYNAIKNMYSFYDDCNPTFKNYLELENKF